MTSRSRLKSVAHAIGSTAVAFSLTALVALAPPPGPTRADLAAAYNAAHPQTLKVVASAPALAATDISRDTFSMSAGYQQLAEGGTNYDWAKLVLLSGKWPMSDGNVTAILRWMRQENGVDNWWNRDNPLNNGWGSGGNAGTGHYPNLIVAARQAADALTTYAPYAGIRKALAKGGEAKPVEHAIWNSPWATGHYANGGHWSYVEVPRVKAPDSAW